MPPDKVDDKSYHQKYLNLKKKFKFLLYENESFQEELRKGQRKLIRINRDKSFLLDRLLKYENVETSTSDSDATVSSDSENELQIQLPPVRSRKRAQSNIDNQEGTKKRAPGNTDHQESSKKRVPSILDNPESSKKKVPSMGDNPDSTKKRVQSMGDNQESSKKRVQNVVDNPHIFPTSTAFLNNTNEIKKKKPRRPTAPKLVRVPAEIDIFKDVTTEPLPLIGDGHMTSEEIERHLESRRVFRDLIPEKTPLTLPIEIFSNETLEMDCDILE